MPHLVIGGDIGDAIAALPILRQLGGGKLTMIPTPHPGARPWKAGAEMLMPLFRAQPYVEEVEWSEVEPKADYNTAHFRKQGCYSPYITLCESQAKSIGLKELDLSPWLEAHPSAHSTHHVVFSRTQRYRNQKFPWLAAVRKYGATSIFVGLQVEYQEFQMFGVRMEFYRIRNFLDAAELIQGSRFLMANQSCFGWLAMGLGKKLIQESHAQIHDSRCPRPDNVYHHDGTLILP